MDKQMQFLIYKVADENRFINAFIQNETIWVTANQMAVLFDKSESTIRKHINNVFEEKELERENNTQKLRVDGVKQPVAFYNLDTIISVGYRVNSHRATNFRIWATQVLKEYMLKGFAMDDERLKQGKTTFGKDYFRELLERVRSIRASERRIWQQITDIFAECSIDYDRNSPVTRSFYAMVQNKFHYAIAGQTAAEIIYTKADRNKEHMGLTTWKNAPEGRILKSDVSVAKNYLSEKEIRQLERAVTGYFDYIEDLIERENTFNMEEFAASVNEFLTFRRYDLLPDKGKVSREQALEKAYAEYDAFNKTQKITSDFDLLLKATEKWEKEMSNLEELIERLCPDGVEYKRLGDIGRISMCKRVLKSQTNSVSGVPFYKIGTFGKEADSYISEELFLDYKSRYPYPKKGDVLISASGTIGRTVIFDGKPSYFQDSNIIWVANNEEFLTNKFLYYIYQTNPWKVADGGTIQRLYNSDLEKIQLPVPPLEVQREIVRILDNFAIATTEIQQKLQEELAARQKQYEYYRDFLLTFKSNESTI